MSKDFSKGLEDQIRSYSKGFPELEQELRTKLSRARASKDARPRMVISPEAALETVVVDDPDEVVPVVVNERIVITSHGARPVMRIVDNRATTEFIGPDSDAWTGVINEAKSRLDAIIPAVGRIELMNSEFPWVGTGWMIADGIIVTNRHVAKAFARLDRATDRYVFRNGLRDGTMSSDIDFREEEDRADENEHPITNILWVSDDDDVAFLSVERARGGPPLAEPIDLSDKAAEDMAIAAIGYPMRDPSIRDQVLVQEIFGDVYEKKRLAPGRVKDVQEKLMTHDCSTLGGNSGSVLIDLATGDAIGLHCGGYLDDSANIAVPAARLRQLLAQAQQNGRRDERVDPDRTKAPQPIPDASGGTITLRLNVPIEVTVKVGSPALWTGNLPPLSGLTGTAPIEEAVRFARQTIKDPDVLNVRAGYRFKNGWITDEPVVVVEVKEKVPHGKLESTGKTALPREVLGVGVDVRTAALPVQLMGLGVDLIALERVSRPAGYKEPPGYDDPDSEMALKRVVKRMKAIFHVSPDSGFPNLREFFGRVREHLTATMYEWENNHVSDAIEAAIRPSGRKLRMVTQKHGVAGSDATESAVADMKQRLGSKFKHVWASVQGPRRLIQNSYHIKVASRDGEEFWLSSGNWKDSNQADIDPAGTNDTSNEWLLKHNREWHAIIEEPGLAGLFQRYIEYDFQQATQFPLEERADESAALLAAEFFIPIVPVDERARRQARYEEPLVLDQELDVQPLLTPDRDGQGRYMFMHAVNGMIERATSRIYVQNQSFAYTDENNVEIDRFFTILKRKQEEGLDVRIIFRDAKDYHREADMVKQQELIERLKDFGLDVSPTGLRLQSKCHTKGIIVDSKEVLLGSQNITNQGALFNRDASLLIRTPVVAKYFERIFLYDWDNLAHNNAEEVIGGIRPAPINEETPVGFRRVSLAELLDQD